MTPRRQPVPSPMNQPVRLYKMIALTFLLVTVVLLGVIIFMSSKRATIVIESKGKPVQVHLPIAVAKTESKDTLKGVVTSTLITLNKNFTPTGLKEEPNIATGVVTIHNESSQPQALVATTQLLSADDVLFRLKDRVTVPANSTVKAAVYADESGAKGNIGPSRFTIVKLATAKQRQIYATSDAAMTGGVQQVGVVSEDDKEKAEKVLLQEMETAGAARLSALYKHMKGAYTTVQHVVETTTETGDTVPSFSMNGKATIVAVFYDEDKLRQWTNEELSRKAASDIEIIEANTVAPAVTIDEYDPTEGTATLDVFAEGVAMLNPESRQLEKPLFFGKTKEEIRRYVLHLDHVHGVEVNFSPTWMLTVPHINDHVSIVVKRVE